MTDLAAIIQFTCAVLLIVPTVLLALFNPTTKGRK